MPPCGLRSRIQAVSSTAQSHRWHHPVGLPWMADEDGGGISEPSGPQTADPTSHTPVAISLHQRGCPRLRTECNGRPRTRLPRALGADNLSADPGDAGSIAKGGKPMMIAMGRTI